MLLTSLELGFSAIAKSGLIVTFSQKDPQLAIQQLSILYENGISVVEFMARTPQSESVFRSLVDWKKKFAKDCFLGIGTIKTLSQLKTYVDLQADFFVSPVYISDVDRKKLPLYIPGVATPSEISTVIEQSFSVCKIFPANCLGGPEYIKSIKSVFPEIQFIPSGGIALDEEIIMRYQKAGALCVSLGGSFWTSLSEPSWEKQMHQRSKQAVQLTEKYFAK